MQNRIKKIFQYCYIFYIHIHAQPVQKPMVFLRQAIQSSVKCYVIENTYFSYNISQSA